MAFTDKDRVMLVKTHTDVGWIKETHEKRLVDLENEDALLHGRINKVRNTFTGVSTMITAAGAGLAAWLKGN
ncbi:hypothetical protein LCGC14_2028440 [marine sediment metagenome]|uniref:Uncharacterized protein n=1 Tax=marine sediment metagenome TaxID=412755 RepID=A0A0F9HSH5_9ZZZZ